jgi:histidinol phosphatase-like PHP family hydrolase
MYKIETHLHTVYSSRCGHLDAETIVDRYLEKGYNGIIVTDHFNRITCEFLNADDTRPDHAAQLFLQGYQRLREEGLRKGMQIYKGAEFRFDGSDNDYLVIGYPDELLYDPDRIFREGLPAFSRRCREAGALLIQAHPYRGNCTPADPQYLDGVEVLNRNPNWDNHNDWALEFAHKHGLIQTSGSDCHKTYQIGNGGILTETLPESDAELMALLRSRNYTLI